MNPEIFACTWTVIDGVNGVTIYPDSFTIKEAIDEYGYEGVHSVEIAYGYGGRLSMPGYLDCTDWTGVFETENACLAALNNMYLSE